MTMPEVAQAAITPASRKLSHDLFGRDYQLEVASAVANLDGPFLVEELCDEVKRRAQSAGVDPPKPTAVRKNLERLVAAGAVEMLASGRPGSPAHYRPATDSVFWPFATELYART